MSVVVNGKYPVANTACSVPVNEKRYPQYTINNNLISNYIIIYKCIEKKNINSFKHDLAMNITRKKNKLIFFYIAKLRILVN